jgi:hypothetical protein
MLSSENVEASCPNADDNDDPEAVVDASMLRVEASCANALVVEGFPSSFLLESFVCDPSRFKDDVSWDKLFDHIVNRESKEFASYGSI